MQPRINRFQGLLESHRTWQEQLWSLLNLYLRVTFGIHWVGPGNKESSRRRVQVCSALCVCACVCMNPWVSVLSERTNDG